MASNSSYVSGTFSIRYRFVAVVEAVMDYCDHAGLDCVLLHRSGFINRVATFRVSGPQYKIKQLEEDFQNIHI